MTTRSKIALTVVAAVVALQGGASALRIASQNSLHLSDSPRGQAKREAMKTEAATFDVFLIQEAMTHVTIANVTPGKYAFQLTSPKGASSYKERYVVVYNTALTPLFNGNGGAMLDYTGGRSFARPPSGSLLRDGAGKLLWVVDFHAVFGKSVTLRRDEARDMAHVYQWFQQAGVNGVTTNNVVLAGDWNLGADDQGFAAIKNLNQGNIRILPNVQTSLTRTGGLSEPYDHFVADSARVAISNCTTIPIPFGQTIQWFRANVSDHLGVQCDAAY